MSFGLIMWNHRNRKIKTFANKVVNLGLSVLQISILVINKFSYDNVKPKYREETKLCYVVTDSFIVYMKAEDIYPDIENHLEKRLDTSNFELQRPSNIVKKQKVIGLIKNKLGEKIMGEFAVLIPKTYSYLTDDLDGNKKKQKKEKSVP